MLERQQVIAFDVIVTFVINVGRKQCAFCAEILTFLEDEGSPEKDCF